MSSLPNDWRNYSRGVGPDEWVATWVVLPNCRVAGTDLEPADCLEVSGEAVATRRAVAWSIWDNQVGRGTQETLALYYIDTAGVSETPLTHLRIGGMAGAENGYYASAGTSTLIVRKLSAGVSSSLGSTGLALTAKRYWWVRMGATGTTVRVRAWALGSAEPSAWSVTVTDSSFSDGQIGIGVYDASTVTRCFFFSVGVNGSSAPDQSALPVRLRDVLKDPAAQIEYWLKLSYADPATGVTYTKWVSHQGRGRLATGDLDFPSASAFLPVLADPGSAGSTLSQDLQFSGQAVGAGGFTVQVDNRDGALAFLGQATPGGAPTYTLAGLRQVVYAGSAGGPTRAFEPFAAATCAAEPTLAAVVTLQMASDEDRLSTPLRIGHYAGVRTCQKYTGGSASAPWLAAYDLAEFTVMARFGVAATPTAGQFPPFISKSASTTSRNFLIIMLPTGTAFGVAGGIAGVTSVGGVANKNRLNSTKSYADGTFYIAVYAHSAMYGNYLLITNGGIEEFVSSASEGVPDFQNVPVTWGGPGLTAPASTCDQRVYDHWLTPDEARAEIDKLASASAAGLIGAWVGDDGSSGSTPTVVTDYSPNANNATITGTFVWTASDLGDASLVGKLKPFAAGRVRQAFPDRSDSVRSRYTYNDGEITDSLTTKSKGAALTRGTNFSDPPSGGLDTSYQGAGVFLFAGANPDPVTVDFNGAGSIVADSVYYPARLARAIITSRGDQALHRDVDHGWFEAAARLAPYPAGFYRKGGGSAPAQSEVLNEILGDSGQAYRLDRDDRISACQLLPTILPGPYGNDYCLEFTGHPRQELVVPSFTFPSSSCTVCGWVYSLQPEGDSASDTSNVFSGQTLLQVGASTAPNVATVLTPYPAWGQGQIRHGFSQVGISSSSVLTNQGLVPWAGWVFVAFAYVLNTSFTVYAAPKGGTLAATPIANVPGLAAPTAGTGDLRIGNGAGAFIGSLQHWQIWNSAKSLAQLQALMTTPPVGSESGLLAYLPMTEASGPPVELVSGKAAQWGNIRRSPRFVLDYTISGDSIGKFGGPMPLRPAYEVVVSYNVADHPLTEQEIVVSVTGAARQSLKETEQRARFYSSPIAYNPTTNKGYKKSYSIPIVSRFAGQQGASVLAKVTGYRFSPARSVAEVTDAPRLGLDAQLLDEVLVKAGAHTGLPATGLSYRIVRLAKTFLTGRTTMGLWR